MGLADNAARAAQNAKNIPGFNSLPKYVQDSITSGAAKASAGKQTAVKVPITKPVTKPTTTKPTTTKPVTNPPTTKPPATTTTTSSGGASGGASVSSVPASPDPKPITSSGSVKSATPDIVRAVSEIPVPSDQMASIILNDIGGQELISISRNDLINGQSVTYEPIADAKSLSQFYNPNNIIYLSETLDKVFNRFPIRLDSKIPNSAGNNVSFSDNKVLIQLKDIQKDELVEVEVIASGSLLDDTIYTGE